jgi:hypothetical protein
MSKPNRDNPSGANEGPRVYPSPSQHRQRPGMMALHTPHWPWVLAMVCALGLLLAFQHVVHTGAQQGAERVRSAAAESDAVWRCNYSLEVGPRESCRAQPTAAGPIKGALHTASSDAPVPMARLSR